MTGYIVMGMSSERSPHQNVNGGDGVHEQFDSEVGISQEMAQSSKGSGVEEGGGELRQEGQERGRGDRHPVSGVRREQADAAVSSGQQRTAR